MVWTMSFVASKVLLNTANNNQGCLQFPFLFIGLPSDVLSAVHLCCGYPEYLDQDNYKKADKTRYIDLAKLLDESGINQVRAKHVLRSNKKLPL